MATGFYTGGVDVDTLYTAGNSGLTTGFKVPGGADLGSVLLGYATGAKRGASGFKNSAGTDLSDLFQNSAVPILTLANPTPDTSSSATATNPSTANGGFVIQSADGVINPIGVGSSVNGVTAGTASNAWIYVTCTSGSTVTAGSDALDTWIQLSANRTYNFVRSGVGVRNGTFAIYFATDGAGSGQTTPGTITCSAEVESA
jgi:hypothetical protein